MKAYVKQIVICTAAAIVSLGLAGCGEPAPSEPEDDQAAVETAQNSATPAQPTKVNISSATTAPVVVFLGDSLTAGFGLPIEAALPDQVAHMLAAQGQQITAINAGVSGDTTANGLARYDWSVTSATPDLLIIALGANDYLMDIDPDTTRANLAAIIERARASDLPVILAGLEPRGPSGAATPTDSRERRFAEIYPSLSAEYDVPLYPALLQGVADNPALLQADGLHPTREGIVRVAEQLSRFLTPEIKNLNGTDQSP